MEDQPDYWAPRRCLRTPIPEIYQAAALLDLAAGMHLAGEHATAQEYLVAADMDEIRTYTKSLWGSPRDYPEQITYLRRRELPGFPDVPPLDRDPKREPTAADKREIIARWGRHCLFCGIPLIRVEVPKLLRRHYPEIRIWGSRNVEDEQHAAFQLMWMQYDHVVPHHLGGRTDASNVVVTCSACNFGKGRDTIEALGLMDPRTRPVARTSWDGLERLLAR